MTLGSAAGATAVADRVVTHGWLLQASIAGPAVGLPAPGPARRIPACEVTTPVPSTAIAPWPDPAIGRAEPKVR